jgi:head-tail adaptor
MCPVYVRMSKKGFESVLEFTKDDISRGSRNRRPISAAERLHVSTYCLATNKVAMSDARTQLMHFFTVMHVASFAY